MLQVRPINVRRPLRRAKQSSLATAIFESIDLLAERLRRIGGTTIRSISHIGKLQTIKGDDQDFVQPDKMIEELLSDNRHIAERQRAAI